MSEKRLPFRDQLREVLRGYFKVVRKHPWLLTLPGFVLWYGMNTKEERAAFIRRAVEDDR